MKQRLHRSLIAGLLVWLPLTVTFFAIRFVFNALDGWFPQDILGLYLPGIGVLLFIVVVLLTGVITTNYIGKQIVDWGETLVKHIPFAHYVHVAVKELLLSLFVDNEHAFNKVLLIQFPRPGVWSLALQTGKVDTRYRDDLPDDMIAVFVPTTPNPSATYLMLVPSHEVIEVDMTIEVAMRLILSSGVSQPAIFENPTWAKNSI